MSDDTPPPFTPEQEIRIREMIAADRVEQDCLRTERLTANLKGLNLVPVAEIERYLRDPCRR